MGFVRKVANIATFGAMGALLPGGKKKDKPAPSPSLVTGDYNKPAPVASLVNSKPTLY